MRHRLLVSASTVLVAALASCSRAPALFSEPNARAHVGMLAGTIGSRPAGTPANARAREYIVDQLRRSGLQVRVQETDARQRDLGLTARVSNIIGVLPGSRHEAVGLVSHYDSVAEGPGAGDDAFGVAVSLEAARVFAARSDRTWTLLVLVTDAEEDGLMGASALMTDRDVVDRLHAYLNIESTGSSGPPVLFETGPGNAWLLAPWARRAPHPRGGSYAVEIYRRLPNDTDFSVFRRRNIPGLNFAVIGDSYAYHTARDTPERISTRTLQTAGENIVAIVDDLQTRDITQRSPAEPTYFDIGGTVGVSYGPMLSWLSALAALLLGMVAWLRMAAHAFRIDGVGRWLVGALWAVLSAAAVAGAMIGCTWLLRAAREVYHPWYARPDRLFALLLVAGVTVGWSMARAGQWLPARAHGPRHPAIIWSLVLPIWIGLAGATAWAAPAASYLWVLPLLTAGVLLSVVPPASSMAVRAASIVVLAVAAALWLRESVELLRFVVAVMGRLTMVTPVFVYAAVMSAPAIMIVPPLLAGFVTARSVPAPTLFTALLLIATAAAAGFAYAAPAYTYEQPQRRHVRAIQEGDAGTAIWEVASLEPGLDLAPEAPGHWSPVADAPAASIPMGRLVLPFVFRSTGPGLGPAPVAVAGYTVNPLADGVELSVSVVPREPGVAVSFVLPAGLTPARSNLPGVVRRGRWTATFVAPPPEGVAFRASFGPAQAAQIRDVRVAARLRWFPSGGGPQRLPAWLPQDRAVWSAAATWVLPAEPPIAPVPPLR